MLAITAKHALVVLFALYAAVGHIAMVEGVFAACALRFFGVLSEFELFLATA